MFESKKRWVEKAWNEISPSGSLGALSTSHLHGLISTTVSSKLMSEFEFLYCVGKQKLQ